MKGHFLIFGGDKRLDFSMEYLQNAGYSCSKCSDISQLHKNSVILPYPAVRNGKISGTDINAADFLQHLQQDCVVIGGGLDFLSSKKIDLAKDEQYLCDNAAITAEGAIALAKPFVDGTVLVIGYGRIGKHLVHLLQNRVVIASRRRVAAVTSDETGKYSLGLREYSCVFNTVPAEIMNAEQLSQLNTRCRFFDLASPPYGISVENRGILGERYQIAGGLPAKFAPKRAGICYAQAILRNYREDL